MLHLRFFGAPVIRLDDQPLPTLARSPLLTSLLAFLVTYRDRSHSRSVLAAIFWPDLPEARARQYLNTHLSRLRRALKSPSTSPYLLSDSQTVQFNAAAPFWLDVAEFEAAIAILHRTSGSMADLTPEALGGLERAVDLYRGDFLEGVYTDWCLSRREQLREQYLATLETLTQAYQTRGQNDAALRAAQQLARADPLREEAHYQLIQLHLRLGRLAGARSHYQHYEVLWHDELKLPSSARMQALLREIEPETASPSGSLGSGIFRTDIERLQQLLTLWRSLPEPHSPEDHLRREQVGDPLAECSGQLGQALKARSANAQARDYLELAVGTLASLPASCERHERELAFRRDLDQLYDLRADREKQAENLQRIAALVENLADPAAHADLLARRAWLAMQQENYLPAITLATQMLQSYRDNGQQESLAHRLLGIAYDRTGDFRAALEHHTRALALDGARNDVWNVYLGLNNLGSVLNNMGHYTAALEHLHRAQTMTPPDAPLYRRATVAGNIGNVLMKLGKLPQAADYLREAMGLVWQSGDRERECWLGGRLALLYQRRGERERALTLAHYYYQAAQGIQGLWDQTLLAELLATLYVERAEGQTALAWATHTAELARMHHFCRYSIRGEMRRAQAHLLLEQPSAAFDRVQRAVRIFEAQGHSLEEEAEIFWTYAQSAQAVGEEALAISVGERARKALLAQANLIADSELRGAFLRHHPLALLLEALPATLL